MTCRPKQNSWVLGKLLSGSNRNRQTSYGSRFVTNCLLRWLQMHNSSALSTPPIKYTSCCVKSPSTRSTVPRYATASTSTYMWKSMNFLENFNKSPINSIINWHSHLLKRKESARKSSTQRHVRERRKAYGNSCDDCLLQWCLLLLQKNYIRYLLVFLKNSTHGRCSRRHTFARIIVKP